MPRWLIAIVLMSGCAFSLSGPAPNRPSHEIPKCDTSKGLVALDGVMATAAGLVALTVVAEDGGAVALLPLAIGALYVGGAIHGSRAVDECKKEIGLFESELASRNMPPPMVADEAGPPRPTRAAVDAPPPRPIAAPIVHAAPPLQAPPQQQQPQPKPAAKQAPAPAPSDDWSDFWREVP